MEMKKTPQADLENERTTFFLLGFVLVLATLFVLLEWTTEESLSPDWAGFSSLLIEEEYNESLAIALESQKPSLDTPEKEMEKQPTLVAYEDFNVAEKTPDTEEALHKLFDETNAEPEKPVSQVTEEQIQAIDPIYTEAEVMPQFPGGYTELNRFLFARLEYPPSAYSQRIQGKVWCSFIVNK
ncbi:MAG: hypothetical protein LBV57_06850, partial [Candidatus Symbiothrix sp.]|nr:hypothetical protein [Candidatus Symbiothrix sp.]